MADVLKFEAGPDAVQTGAGAGHRSAFDVLVWSAGAWVVIANDVPTLGEAGNDGNREWLEFAYDVSAYVDAADFVLVGIRYSDAIAQDTLHGRRVRIERDGVPYLPDYPDGHPYTAEVMEGDMWRSVGSENPGSGQVLYGTRPPQDEAGQWNMATGAAELVSPGDTPLRFYFYLFDRVGFRVGAVY